MHSRAWEVYRVGRYSPWISETWGVCSRSRDLRPPRLSFADAIRIHRAIGAKIIDFANVECDGKDGIQGAWEEFGDAA